MWQNGDYTVLSLNNRLYTDKPPLFFLAVNGFGAILGGVNEWSARLPSAVAALLTIFVIFAFGTSLYDRQTGLFAALIFATSVQIIIRSRWASLDMVLNFFVLLAIFLLWQEVLKPNHLLPRSRPWKVWVAWFVMALATLTKGPVGVLLPLLAVLSVLFTQGNWTAIRTVLAPTGILLYFGVVFAWLGLFMARQGVEPTLTIVTHQTITRYLNAWNQQHPFWFYLWRFPSGLMPWSLFFPSAIFQAIRDAKSNRDHRHHVSFLLFWIASIFIFFSLASGKRGVYLIPIYPAAAILLGRLFVRTSQSPEDSFQLVRIPLYLWLIATTGLLGALHFTAVQRYPDHWILAILLGFILAAGAGTSLWLFKRRRVVGSFSCLLGSLVMSTVFSIQSIIPLINQHKNIKSFANQVRARLHDDAGFGTTERKRDTWIFYTDRFCEVLNTDASVIQFLSRSGEQYLIIDGTTLNGLRDRLPSGVTEILRDRVSGQQYHLLWKSGEL